MKKAVCFVDDDAAEVRRFRDNLSERYIVGAGTTLADALAELRRNGRSTPHLLLLDLYFGRPLDAHERAAILAADEALAEREEEMRALLARYGQSAEGGFALATEAAQRLPHVPRAFFSRRAFLADAMKAHKDGLAVLEKPDPAPGQGYDAAFRKQAHLVAAEIDRIIVANGFWARHGHRIQGFAVGLLGLVAKLAWDTWVG